MPLKPFSIKYNDPNALEDALKNALSSESSEDATEVECEEINDELVHGGAEAALSSVGLGDLGVKESSNPELTKIRKIFSRAGAGIDDVAKVVASKMINSDSDAACLKASEIALKIQGVFEEIDEKQSPEIHINIVGDGNKVLVNLMCPR